MATILLTNYYAPGPLEVIRQQLPDGFQILALDRPGKAAIIERVAEADYLLVGGRIVIDHEVIESAKRLKMIQRTGVGLDSLDLPLLKSRGIPVYVNAGVNSRSVAEHTVLLILATLRRLPEVDSSVKRGEWKKHEYGIQCHDLDGKTVGLIGAGAIGQTVAEMLRPFRVNLVYTKRKPLEREIEQQLNLQFVDLETLLTGSDVVSLHCPLNDRTRGLMGAREFGLMKQNSVLINTARGPLVDEVVLRHALETGKLLAAGLDVFSIEPIPSRNEILTTPRVVLTPHLGGLALQTFQAMMRNAFGNIICFSKGMLDVIQHKLVVR